MRVTRKPVVAHEEVRQQEHREIDLLAQVREVHRSAPPHRDREAGGVEHRGGARSGALDAAAPRARRPQRFEDRFVGVGEQLGQDPVDDDDAERHVELVAGPLHQLDGLVHRHLLGRGHHVERGELRIGEQLHHPVGLVPHRADLHEVLDRARGVELADHVPGGGGVDHDEVPVGAALDRLAQLPHDLADGEDLLHARRRGGDEVEGPGQWPDTPETGTRACTFRYSRSDASVSICIAKMPGYTWRGSNPTGRMLEQRGEVVLGVDLDEQDPLAPLGGEQRRRRGHRALPDPALPGEEEQPAIEQGRRGAHRRNPLAAEADAPTRSVFRDLDVGDLRRRDADPTALHVGQPHHRSTVAHGSVDLGDDVVGSSVDLEVELFGRVGDTDVKVHAANLVGQPVSPGASDQRSLRPGL